MALPTCTPRGWLRGASVIAVRTAAALLLVAAVACGGPAVTPLDPDVTVVELDVRGPVAADHEVGQGEGVDDEAAQSGGADEAGAAVLVPDVIGVPVAAARADLEAEGLRLDADPLMRRGPRPGDVVLDTRPAAGQPVRAGGVVSARTTVPLDVDLAAMTEAAGRLVAAHPGRLEAAPTSLVVDALVLVCEDAVIDDPAVSFPAFDARAEWYALREPAGMGPVLAELLAATVVTESNARLVLDELLSLLQLSAAPLCPPAGRALAEEAADTILGQDATVFLEGAQPPVIHPEDADRLDLTGVLNPTAEQLSALLAGLGVPAADRALSGNLVAAAATACENLSAGESEPLFLDERVDEARLIEVVGERWCTGPPPAPPAPNPGRPAVRAVVEAASPVLGDGQAAQLLNALGLDEAGS